jgi:alpha-beta hydrolase superfamily lysophospholipase
MDDPFANVPAIGRFASEGWVYVAPDYVGLGTGGGHAYLVGDDAARAVLDAIRAARAIPGLAQERRVVVWGHSQGGNTALWTGIRAHAYAPDVELLGVAAQAPASDLKALVKAVQASMFGKIVSAYLVRAYAETYPDVVSSDYVHPMARFLAADIASRCVGGRATLFSVAETFLLPRTGIFINDPTEGPLGARLAENTPRGPINAPVFIAQGSRDDVVLAEIQQRYVADRCLGSQPLLYRVYDGLDHVSLVGKTSPLADDLVAWTRERFAGRPAATNCPD